MNRRFHIFGIVFSDFLVACLSYLLFYFCRKLILAEDPAGYDVKLLVTYCLIIGIFWLGVNAVFGYYTEIYAKSRVKELLLLLISTFVGAVIVFFILLLDDQGVNNYKLYYLTFAAFYFIHYFLSAVSRIIFISYIKELIKTKKLKFNALLIGSDKRAYEVFCEIQKSFHILGLDLIGYVHVNGARPVSDLCDKIPDLGTVKDLDKIIKENNVEQVIIAVEASENDKINSLLARLYRYNLRISIIPDFYHLILGSVKVNQVFGIPLVEINQDLIPQWQKILKRGIDISISLFVLIFGFPVLLLIALITKVTSKGPIFFLQERVGKNGKPFKIIKFRSMYVGAEKKGPALSSDYDPRITPWGRFMRKGRIDEFPQFFNVLKGDMSLVGPRPERQYYIDQIASRAPHYLHLHRVRPGITSLGQVKFGYAENVDEMVKRLKYDILYIENMSLALDFRIILYTVVIMAQGRGK
ncbi:MAG: sugar transferase [Cytophagaceae bacterium]